MCEEEIQVRDSAEYLFWYLKKIRGMQWRC